MNNGPVNKKRRLIRLVLVFALIIMGFLLYYYGKEHEILFDNKTVEINGQSYEAAEFVRITVNGDEMKALELYSNERDLVKVTGPKHAVKVEIIDENTDKVIKSEERIFNFGKTSSLMISVPAVAEKAQDVYLPLPGTMAESAAPETTGTGTEAAPGTGSEIGAPALSD